MSNKDYSVLQPASGMGRVNKKLTITDRSSKMFYDLKKNVLDSIENQELGIILKILLVFFNTGWGVLPDYYE